MGRGKFRGSSSGPLGRGPDICQHLTQHRSIERLHQPFSYSESQFTGLVPAFQKPFAISRIANRNKPFIATLCRSEIPCRSELARDVRQRKRIHPEGARCLSVHREQARSYRRRVSEPHPSCCLRPPRPEAVHPASPRCSCAPEFHRGPVRPDLHAPQAPIRRVLAG